MTDARASGSFAKSEPDRRVSLFPDLKITRLCRTFEKQAFSAGYRFVAGVDEVGRGSLAGPVVAAACILDASKPLPRGLNDSKQLTRAQREEIAEKLRRRCLAYAIGEVSADEIDRINILEASKRAMLAAIDRLRPAADFLLVDAVELRESQLPRISLIKGDAISVSIAAASVIAKTHRDELMRRYDSAFPQYGFCRHVGYGTSEHLESLRKHGPCQLHRLTFHGVK